MTAANSHIFKFQLEQKKSKCRLDKTMAAHRSAPASFWCHTHYKCSHCHQEKKKWLWRLFLHHCLRLKGVLLPKDKRLTGSQSLVPIPTQRTGSEADRRAGERHRDSKRERERVLKADLTLGSVTTDQNPLKAIDHFHYSSHVPHLETVYQTQKSLCGQIHTPTHAHEARMPAHTHARKTIQLSIRASRT